MHSDCSVLPHRWSDLHTQRPAPALLRNCLALAGSEPPGSRTCHFCAGASQTECSQMPTDFVRALLCHKGIVICCAVLLSYTGAVSPHSVQDHVRSNCSESLFKRAFKEALQKVCSATLHTASLCSVHFAPCMDMHGFTLVYIYIYIYIYITPPLWG